MFDLIITFLNETHKSSYSRRRIGPVVIQKHISPSIHVAVGGESVGGHVLHGADFKAEGKSGRFIDNSAEFEDEKKRLSSDSSRDVTLTTPEVTFWNRVS